MLPMFSFDVGDHIPPNNGCSTVLMWNAVHLSEKGRTALLHTDVQKILRNVAFSFSARRIQGPNSNEKRKQLMQVENSCGAMAEIRAVAGCVFLHQRFAGVYCSGSSPLSEGLPNPSKAIRISRKCMDYWAAALTFNENPAQRSWSTISK